MTVTQEDLLETGTTQELFDEYVVLERERMRAGQPGFREPFTSFVRGLRLGNLNLATPANAIRLAQARRYWNIPGLGEKIGISSFDSYLEKIPALTDHLLEYDPAFPLLVLIEPRPGLKWLCAQNDIGFEGDDSTLIPYDEKHREFNLPAWIRVQNGARNRGHSVRDCRQSFGDYGAGLTAIQGICTLLQHDRVIATNHSMDLPGTIDRQYRDHAPSLGTWGSGVSLRCFVDSSSSPFSGSASRRKD